MPRDGSNVYHVPVGTQAVTNTTIASTPYNGFLGDLEGDLNLPRPIVAGGTGATSAAAALVNLGGENATQVVTNYDTFVFVSGSFYSAPGATSAPEATAWYYGNCYVMAGNTDYMKIHAWDYGSVHTHYVRTKSGGTWGAWQVQKSSVADLDAAYVNVAGDTMTGSLTVNSSLTIGGAVTPVILMAPSSGATSNTQIYQNANNYVFSSTGAGLGNIYLINLISGDFHFYSTASIGATTASSSPTTGALTVAGGMGVGGDVRIGSEFWSMQAAAQGIIRFGSSGANYLQYVGGVFNLVGGPLKVFDATASTSPTTGALTVAGGLGVSGTIYGGGAHVSAQTATTGSYYFGNSGTVSLSYDGTNFTLSPGPVKIASTDLTVGSAAATAAIYFTSTGGRYLTHDGTSYSLVGGAFTVSGITKVQPATTVLSSANAALQVGYLGGVTQYGISVRCFTDVTTAIYFANASNAASGSITVTAAATAYNTSSDERLKEDLKSFDAGRIVDDTNVYDFKWKSTGERAYGVIGQQAVEVYPTAVTYLKEEDWYGVDYSKYVPVLLQELKALRVRVAQLEAKVNQ